MYINLHTSIYLYIRVYEYIYVYVCVWMWVGGREVNECARVLVSQLLRYARASLLIHPYRARSLTDRDDAADLRLSCKASACYSRSCTVCLRLSLGCLSFASRESWVSINLIGVPLADSQVRVQSTIQCSPIVRQSGARITDLIPAHCPLFICGHVLVGRARD